MSWGTAGKSAGKVRLLNQSLSEGVFPDVLPTLPYQKCFVACGRRCASRYQSGSLPSTVDAAQRSLAPEPWGRHPRARRSRACGGCRPALLGRSGVWQVASPAVATGLGATPPGGSVLASPAVWSLAPGGL